MRQERQDRKRIEVDKMEQANFPFINGVSQEVKRTAGSRGIRCTIFAPCVTRALYNVKDQLPLGSMTHVVYTVKCQACNEQYVSETLHSIDV